MGAFKNNMIMEMEESEYDDFIDLGCTISLQQKLRKKSFWAHIIYFFRRILCK